VEALAPSVLEIADAEAFTNANTPEELAEIAQGIARR
jgi:molybdopterin-guanine dinucleotide biosynthesis protein A